MSETYPATSTYRAVFNIERNDGSPLPVGNATIKYALTRRRGGGSQLVTVSDADPEMEVEPGGEIGRVEVELPPADVPEGTVFAELRVEISDTNVVVVQRSVTFSAVATQA